MQDDLYPGCFVPESVRTLLWLVRTLILVDSFMYLSPGRFVPWS